MSSMTWGIIGVVVGLVIGAGIAWLVFSRRTHTPTVGQLKAENDRFKEEVNAHFVQTAELINDLTDSYKKVYDHLSDGAERLVDTDAVRERMPQVGQQEVRLRHIGAPSRDRKATSAPGRPASDGADEVDRDDNSA